MRASPWLGIVIISLPSSAHAYDGACETIDEVPTMPPGTWCRVPGTHLRDVAPCDGRLGGSNNGCGNKPNDPTPACYDSYAVFNFQHFMTGWNGGTFDTQRSRLLLFGGGHRGWAGNDIYAFDIATLSWSRIRDADCIRSEDLNNDADLENMAYYLTDTWQTGEPYAVDPQKPRSRHSYWQPMVVTELDAMCTFGAIGFSYSGQSGSQLIQCYDLVTGQWQERGTVDGGVRHPSRPLYDPLRGTYWIHGASLTEYDATTETSLVHSTNWGAPVGAVHFLDLVRRDLYEIGGGVIWRWDIGLADGAPGAVSLDRQELVSTGPQTIVGAAAYGSHYRPDLDRLIAWDGGHDVFLFAPETLEWTQIGSDAANLTEPPPRTSNGIYGRFAYVASYDVYIVATDVDEDVFFYRLPLTDAVAPAPPTGLAVD